MVNVVQISPFWILDTYEFGKSHVNFNLTILIHSALPHIRYASDVRQHKNMAQG